jgi:hypothetical protein
MSNNLHVLPSKDGLECGGLHISAELIWDELEYLL